MAVSWFARVLSGYALVCLGLLGFAQDILGFLALKVFRPSVARSNMPYSPSRGGRIRMILKMFEEASNMRSEDLGGNLIRPAAPVRAGGLE